MKWKVRSWDLKVLREAIADCFRVIEVPKFMPHPQSWKPDQLSASWLGHSTVLLNFYGLNLITDPVLGSRVGLNVGPLTIGPKRFIEAALKPSQVPPLELILLSHAHMDHLDFWTLKNFSRNTQVICAKHTSDLVHQLGFKNVIELDWSESVRLRTSRGELQVEAVKVKHWGARIRHDSHRKYNGYFLTRNSTRIFFSGDTAYTPLPTNGHLPVHIAIMPIGAYDPWIHSHCTPEEAIQMADQLEAKFIIPVHHQTFKLSSEDFEEPIQRFMAALKKTPNRIGLTSVGETFILP